MLRATNAGQEAILESMSEELGVIAKNCKHKWTEYL